MIKPERAALSVQTQARQGRPFGVFFELLKIETKRAAELRV
jgi:hypothetical protein